MAKIGCHCKTTLATRQVCAMPDRRSRVRVPYFVGPYGRRITLADLPPRDQRCWLPRHKAMVVAAVRHGLLSFGEARRRYHLSLDEYLSWQRAYGHSNPRPGPGLMDETQH